MKETRKKNAPLFIICTNNIMRDKTKRETMPQHYNKADEEISPPLAVGTLTKLHSTVARLTVRAACLRLHLLFHVDDEDWPIDVFAKLNGPY